MNNDKPVFYYLPRGSVSIHFGNEEATQQAADRLKDIVLSARLPKCLLGTLAPVARTWTLEEIEAELREGVDPT